MKKYIVNNEEYVTICSVHDKILTEIQSINSIEQLQSKLELITQLLYVAKSMGQNMEDAIKYKNIVTCGTVDFYSFQRYMNNEIEED